MAYIRCLLIKTWQNQVEMSRMVLADKWICCLSYMAALELEGG